jgi:hypothetical protein
MLHEFWDATETHTIGNPTGSGLSVVNLNLFYIAQTVS